MPHFVRHMLSQRLELKGGPRGTTRPKWQRRKVDFEDKDGVEQVDEFREVA